MFPSKISSMASNVKIVSTQNGLPISAEQPSKDYFCSSFNPARGDLVLGRSSSMAEGACAWTPARLMDSLFVIFDMMACQAEMYDFDSDLTEMNNSPETMNDLADLMFIVLREEKQRKKSDVNNTLPGEATNAGVDGVINYFEGFLNCMEEVEGKIKSGSGSVNQIFTDIPKVVSQHKLDELFAGMSNPLYSAGALKEFADDNARQRIHECAIGLFSRISKGVIDGFIQQGSKAQPIQAQRNEMARIHYFLEGIQMEDVVSNTGSGAHGILAEELRHLYLCREVLGDAVKFYRDNMAVSSPWEEDPELWGRYVASPDKVDTSSNSQLYAQTLSPPQMSSTPEKARVLIEELHQSHMQKIADPDQIFEFAKNEQNQYEFIQSSTGEKYDLEGVLAFVIHENKPDHVYCGLRNGERDSHGKLNRYRYQQPLYIDGHSALTGGKPVLFAGEILFEEGEVKFWNNGSGHYQPDAKHRFTNLTDPVRRLLPEAGFRDYDELTEREITDLERHVKLPKESEGTSSDSDSSLSEDDENAAYIAKLKKNGLKIN